MQRLPLQLSTGRRKGVSKYRDAIPEKVNNRISIQLLPCESCHLTDHHPITPSIERKDHKQNHSSH